MTLGKKLRSRALCTDGLIINHWLVGGGVLETSRNFASRRESSFLFDERMDKSVVGGAGSKGVRDGYLRAAAGRGLRGAVHPLK